jgi:hypothetical protein
VRVSSDLDFQPIHDILEAHNQLSELDKNVLGFTREVDHQWFLSDRQGYRYYREGRAVGMVILVSGMDPLPSWIRQISRLC